MDRVYSPPCPWDTHYQFSIKTLLSQGAQQDPTHFNTTGDATTRWYRTVKDVQTNRMETPKRTAWCHLFIVNMSVLHNVKFVRVYVCEGLYV